MFRLLHTVSNIQYIVNEKASLSTNYIFQSRHQNTGEYHKTKLAVKHLQNVIKLKFSETNVTNQNYPHKDIQSKLNLGILHSIQLRIFVLLSAKIKITKSTGVGLFLWV
jgi:hypothetical protein